VDEAIFEEAPERGCCAQKNATRAAYLRSGTDISGAISLLHVGAAVTGAAQIYKRVRRREWALTTEFGALEELQ
jgi:hypothetical protein